MPSETLAKDLPSALRDALSATDIGRLETLWRSLLTESRDVQDQAVEVFIAHGLFERAAQLRERQGELRSAQDLFRRAGVLADAARLAEQIGDDQVAEAIYRQCIAETTTPGSLEDSDSAMAESRDGHRSPTLRLGLLLLRQGRCEEAVPLLQIVRRGLLAQATRRVERLDEVETALALALTKIQLPEAALALLAAFRSRHPSAPATVSEWLGTLPPQLFPAPTLLLGRYRLQKLLGAGGMGRVFLAEDVSMGRSVALKLLPMPLHDPSQDSRWRRFCHEAQILRALRHPNIVGLVDFSESAGVLVMELMRGGSLGEQPLPLSLAKTRRVLLDVIAGLSAAHAASVLHRDLKPHNLFLDEAHRTKIGDFGAALLAQLGATQTESLVGTLAYMSPEQLEGQPLTFASDLYSLGVTVFQLLTGRLPFVGPDWVSQHLSQPARDPRTHRPTLPAGWAALCRQLLAKSPTDRPESLSQLERLIDTLPIEENGSDHSEEGMLPSADDALQPHVEVDAERSSDGPSRTLLFRTPHSAIYHQLDAKLARGLLIEQFSAASLATSVGQRHLAWLRVMAKLGGPGLQRVLRIVLDGDTAEVHAEEAVSVPLTPSAPLDRRDARVLESVLAAIHDAGEVHGDIANAIVVEKYGAIIQVVGQGPLGNPQPRPTPAQEKAELRRRLAEHLLRTDLAPK